jgi:hypothetical protein
MAPLDPLRPLYMGDDDFERRQPTPPIDTSAAAQQRTSAQERARQTIASPE